MDDKYVHLDFCIVPVFCNALCLCMYLNAIKKHTYCSIVSLFQSSCLQVHAQRVSQRKHCYISTKFSHMETLIIINLVWFVHFSTILNEAVHDLDMSTLTCSRERCCTILQDRYRETPKLSNTKKNNNEVCFKSMLYSHVFQVLKMIMQE